MIVFGLHALLHEPMTPHRYRYPLNDGLQTEYWHVVPMGQLHNWKRPAIIPLDHCMPAGTWVLAKMVLNKPILAVAYIDPTIHYERSFCPPWSTELFTPLPLVSLVITLNDPGCCAFVRLSKCSLQTHTPGPVHNVFFYFAMHLYCFNCQSIKIDGTFNAQLWLDAHLILSMHKHAEGTGRNDLAIADDHDKSPLTNAKASILL